MAWSYQEIRNLYAGEDLVSILIQAASKDLYDGTYRTTDGYVVSVLDGCGTLIIESPSGEIQEWTSDGLETNGYGWLKQLRAGAGGGGDK